MKKTLSRLLAIAMTASLVLSGCGGTGGSTSTEEGTSTEGNTTSTEGEATAEAGSDEEIKDLVLPILASRELETFNMLYSQRAEDFENLTQLFDGLLEAVQMVNWFLQLLMNGELKTVVLPGNSTFVTV